MQAGVALFTWRVETNRALASTGTMAPTKVLVSSGVMTTAAKVLTVVIMTLSATSALAKKVTTLLAVPPGQLATKQILQSSKGKMLCEQPALGTGLKQQSWCSVLYCCEAIWLVSTAVP